MGLGSLILLCALPFAAKQTDHLTGGGFDVPGSQSMVVSEALQRDFGAQSNGVSVALKAEPGAGPAERAAAIGRVRREVAAVDGIALAPATARQARQQLRRTGFAILPLQSDLSPDELIDAAATCAKTSTRAPPRPESPPTWSGSRRSGRGCRRSPRKTSRKAEATGFPIVALILLVVFGSLAAAALPLALGFVSVLVTGALIYFISLQMTTSVFVTNMASMIGIGVGDRLLAVHPRPLPRGARSRAATRSEARAEALSTSGLAVTFSGLAVIISLAGLWMVDNQALRSMALGAMTVVAVSILTATTLLPALIAMLGDRVLPGGIVGRVERFFKHRVLRRPVRRARCRDRRRRQSLLGRLDAAGDGAALDRDRRRLGACC